MDAVYWVAFLVGGTFVALSLLGGDHGPGADAAGDADVHGFGYEPGGADLTHDAGADLAHGAGAGFVDLLSLRFLFLFAAFFGLTGLALHHLAGEGEPFTALVAAAVGFAVGFGGNVALRKIGGAQVSSGVTAADLAGRTARVVLPFGPSDRGKVALVAKGQRLVVPARSFGGAETFAPGDEVVVVRLGTGGVAEVVHPGGGLPEPAADALPAGPVRRGEPVLTA